MRNARVLTTLCLTLSIIPMIATTAEADHTRGPCSIHWKRAYYERGDTRPVAALIRCAARRWSVPGGAAKALAVARCESGLRPDADGGVSEGVYQYVNTYWAARADRWLRERWHIHRSTWNARANVVVTMRWVHAMWSWAPWSCS